MIFSFEKRWPWLLALSALLLAGPALAEDPWKKKPSDWTADDALQILTESPWASEKAVAVALMARDRKSGSYVPLEVPRYSNYLVRWETARPVRAAFARLKELGEAASARFQSPPPRYPANFYIITVKNTRPARKIPDVFGKLTNPQLAHFATLKTPRATAHPVAIARSGLGATAAIHFYFPSVHDGEPLLLEREENAVEFRLHYAHHDLKVRFLLEADALDIGTAGTRSRLNLCLEKGYARKGPASLRKTIMRKHASNYDRMHVSHLRLAQ